MRRNLLAARLTGRPGSGEDVPFSRVTKGRPTMTMLPTPPNILAEIVATKRREVEAGRRRMPIEELEAQAAEAPPVRDFRAALAGPGPIRLIAEVKKASPSAGVIRADFDPVGIARTYQAHGANCSERVDRRAVLPGPPVLPGAGAGVGGDPDLAQGFPDRRVPGRRGPHGRRRRRAADRRDPRRRGVARPAGTGTRARHGGAGRVPRPGQPAPRAGRRARIWSASTIAT